MENVAGTINGRQRRARRRVSTRGQVDRAAARCAEQLSSGVTTQLFTNLTFSSSLPVAGTTPALDSSDTDDFALHDLAHTQRRLLGSTSVV